MREGVRPVLDDRDSIPWTRDFSSSPLFLYRKLCRIPCCLCLRCLRRWLLCLVWGLGIPGRVIDGRLCKTGQHLHNTKGWNDIKVRWELSRPAEGEYL